MKTAQALFAERGIASLARSGTRARRGSARRLRADGKEIDREHQAGRPRLQGPAGRARRSARALPLARDVDRVSRSGRYRRRISRTRAACGAPKRRSAISTSSARRANRATSSRASCNGSARKRCSPKASTKASIWLDGGLQIDLRVLPEDVYGNLLQHFTGSREHNIQLRELAVGAACASAKTASSTLQTGINRTCAHRSRSLRGARPAVHSARNAPRHRRDRGGDARHVAGSGRARRPARRFSHALHLERRPRHAAKR